MAEANANSGVPQNSVFHGARGYLTANGKPVGYVQGISGGKQVQYAPLEVLDDIAVAEHVPTGYTVNLSAEVVKVVGRSLIDAGIDVPLASVLTAKALSLVVVDRVTGKAVETY